jgi:probable F420-dependent oxidoreductase
MNLGSVGLWAYQLDLVPSSQAQETAAEIEELGYGALWIPEMIGRESFVSSTLLLAGTKKMVVATGIASIYARDALCANSAWNTVSEAFPDRFLLGLGVSHEVMVSGLRGHDYSKPFSAMKAYLDGMDNGLFTASPASAPPQKVLAALGPKMLELAAERTQGAHPYFIPVEHTAFAREVMGDRGWLCPEQAGDVSHAAELHKQSEAIRLRRRRLRGWGFGSSGGRDRGVGRRGCNFRSGQSASRCWGRSCLHSGVTCGRDFDPLGDVATPCPGAIGLTGLWTVRSGPRLSE